LAKQLFRYVVTGLICLVIGSVLGFVLSNWLHSENSPLITKPGGNWGQQPYVKDGKIYLEFYAHPSNVGDPAIKIVDPTIFFRGSWHHLCSPEGITTPTPITSDRYICQANIAELAIPPGKYQISCNVYDKDWKPNPKNDHANIGLGGSKTITIP
jgi:hypothetical protein